MYHNVTGGSAGEELDMTTKQKTKQKAEQVITEAVEPADDSLKALGEAAAGLVGIAGLWLQHGLRAGRLYVETGAKSLERVAKAMGDLSADLERRGYTGTER